jgi:RNA polymerase sigma-70 factor (ECF subfamily)
MNAKNERPPWFARLVKVPRRLGHSVDDAEDLVQDAYVRFLKYRQTHEIRDEAALLTCIVTNLAINRHRQFKIESRFGMERIDSDLDPADEDSASDPLQSIIVAERLEGAVTVLRRVSWRTCQIFLAHRSGYSYKEISREFGICSRTVQKHIDRANFLLQLRRSPKSRF